MMPPVATRYRCPACDALVETWVRHGGNTRGGVLWTDGKFQGPMWADDNGFRRCEVCNALVDLDGLAPVAQLDPDRAPPEVFATLEDAGPSRAHVIVALRQHLNLSLAQARERVDSAPVLLGPYPPWVGERLVDALRDRGATVTRSTSHDGNDHSADYQSPLPALARVGDRDLWPALASALSLERERAVRTRLLWGANDPDRQRWVQGLARPDDEPAWSAQERANAERLLRLMGDTPDDRILRAELLRSLGRTVDEVRQALEGLAGDYSASVLRIRGLATRGVRVVAVVGSGGRA